MPSTLTAEKVVQQGNSLTLNLIFNDENRVVGTVNTDTGLKNHDPAVSLISQEYLINYLVAFQAKVVRYEDNVSYFVRCVPMRNIKQLKYTANYSHMIIDPVELKTIQCCIKNDQWQLILEFQKVLVCKIFISVNLSISTWVNPFIHIHNDTELVDFELCGEDGMVSFHKAVAVSFSPVIKAGFTGEWGREGMRMIPAPPGTTKETLQHLKDYMYTDTIPETGLKQLLLLASYYIMPDLELRCVLEMLTNISSKEAYNLFEFAMKHQMSQLLFEIMYRVEKGEFSADAIRSHQKW